MLLNEARLQQLCSAGRKDGRPAARWLALAPPAARGSAAAARGSAASLCELSAKADTGLLASLSSLQQFMLIGIV